VLSPGELWDKGNAEDWVAVLGREDEAVGVVASRGGKKRDLTKLHRWFRDWVVGKEGLAKAELVKMMDWKLTRGKMRPLMRFIVALNEKKIEETTKKALSEPALAGDSLSIEVLKAAVTTLSELKGVGTATASVVLSRFNPKLYPFMSDQALELTGPRTYTLGRYLDLAKELNAKAEELNKECGDSDAFTCEQIERAIFTAAVLSEGSGSSKKLKK